MPINVCGRVNKNCIDEELLEKAIVDFTQLLLFEIDKQYAVIDTYKNIVEFCIYLRFKIQSDILVTSEVHDDICLLKEQEII